MNTCELASIVAACAMGSAVLFWFRARDILFQAQQMIARQKEEMQSLAKKLDDDPTNAE